MGPCMVVVIHQRSLTHLLRHRGAPTISSQKYFPPRCSHSTWNRNQNGQCEICTGNVSCSGIVFFLLLKVSNWDDLEVSKWQPWCKLAKYSKCSGKEIQYSLSYLLQYSIHAEPLSRQSCTTTSGEKKCEYSLILLAPWLPFSKSVLILLHVFSWPHGDFHWGQAKRFKKRHST